MAYEESADSGQSEVFIDTFPERHRAYQISTNGEFGARWNPQGGEVFYRSPAGKLMVVSLNMDKNSADPSMPRELFALPVSTVANLGSQYNVGQDGKRFLILSGREESSTRIDHELAGAAEIEAFSGAILHEGRDNP